MKYQKTKNNFNKAVIKLRRARGFTQAQLAEALGVSRDMITYYESRVSNPTKETIANLSTFFNVEQKVFLENAEKTPLKSNSKLDQLVDETKKLSPLRQKMIANMIEGALKS